MLFHIDRFGTAGVEHLVFPDGLVERGQVVLAVQFQENIVVEIHEYQRHRASLVADATIVQLEGMRGVYDAGDAVYGVQAAGPD